jgi:hypothetical protein
MSTIPRPGEKRRGDILYAQDVNGMSAFTRRTMPVGNINLGLQSIQTPYGQLAKTAKTLRSRQLIHPFRVFNASDEEGLKVRVHYGAVIDISNWKTPRIIDPEIEGVSLIPVPDVPRPTVKLPEQGTDIFLFLEISLEPGSGRVKIAAEEEEASPVTIRAFNKDEMGDALAAPGKVFIHIARIIVKEPEQAGAEGEEEARRIERIDQILGSHVLWPMRTSHPFAVLDASTAEEFKVAVAYGAVIDMSDWQDPKLYVPRINGVELSANLFANPTALTVPEEKSELCVVIKQGENGKIKDADDAIEVKAFEELPPITDGTLYVRIAKLDAVVAGEDRLVKIEQILGSHIVWPFKPDWAGWQQKNGEEDEGSALWLGKGSSYAQDCDILSDIYINVQRDEFDNGRDGDAVFALKMEEDKNFELAFDKDQSRGLWLLLGAQSSTLQLDRKSTASGGVTLQSSESEASVLATGPSEGGSVKASANNSDGRIKAESKGGAVIDIDAAANDPLVKLTGPGTTKVGTIAGKTIELREIEYLDWVQQKKKAYFLCSPPESDEDSNHTHSGNEHGHFEQHHSEHGFHHSGHYVDPTHDPDPDDSGAGHLGAHFAQHHSDHNDENHDGGSHHSNHHQHG